MTDWEDLFGTRKWRVATELDGEVVALPGTELNQKGTEPLKADFTRGHFELAGASFHSPLSSARGRKGVILQEVDERGRDIDGSRIAVGKVVLARARKEGSVREQP